MVVRKSERTKNLVRPLKIHLARRGRGVWTNSPIHGEMDRRGRKRERIISFGVSKASSLVS